ncbi:MAG: autotransporter assembly complex family protein [Rhodocyclaceae bacterium]|jgi:translocation and assembly module TamA|nr:autotransporter assembly complex family protein [Rhodocyclaceae bacterium]
MRLSPAPLCLAAILLTMSLVVRGQPVSPPGVELVAPAELAPLLRQHLGLLQDNAPPFELSAARREVADLLATEGYFSPIVTLERGASPRLVVTPGPRTAIVAVDIRFQGAVGGDEGEAAARRERLRQAWTLPVGQPFRQEDWDQAKEGLLEALSRRDFPAAQLVESRAEVDPDLAAARLRVVVDSGPAYTLGALAVVGLEEYPAGLIQGFDPPRPGEPYDRDRLLAFQAALQNTPWFASATVAVDLDQARSGVAPVRVELREAKPRRLTLGAGYSSNNGARAELAYRDSNLARAGWELVSGLRLAQRHRILYGDVFLPPAGQDHRDSLGAQVESSDIEGLRVTGQAFGVARVRPLWGGESRLGLKIQRETRRPEGAASSRSQALTANWGMTWRRVDNLLDPRDGFVLALEMGGASAALLSDRNFVRLHGRAVGYRPVGERDVLILRGEVGATLADSRQGIPQDFLFRAGGAQSVRGYGYQSLGVKEGDAVVGGRYLATLSAEYVHWFRPDWGAAVFADAGNAADQRLNFRLKPGYGAGARWRSPAGPLALDLAWGQDEGRLRLHFAIAIAF